MNQTEQVFLSLLRDYVCGQKLKALPTVDWQALYNLAQSHNVTGLVGRILADLLPIIALQKPLQWPFAKRWVKP